MKAILSSRKFVLVLVTIALVLARDAAGIEPEAVTGVMTLVLAYVGVEGARDIVIEAKRKLEPPLPPTTPG